MSTNKFELCIIIPAHNEASVISITLKNVTRRLSPEHIYVVSDGSTDATASLASNYTANVLVLKTNIGKGHAINHALDYFHLPDRYRFVMPLDADTRLQSDFFDHLLNRFAQDKAQSLACVIGQVTSHPVSWLSAYRTWEYELNQSIHKQAQSYLGGIVVCPGCATVYRTSIFKQLSFPTHSLAEDMDLTFLIHRRHLGHIVYEPKARVITQDPANFRDFIRQIDRWYTGLWQNIAKHNVPWEGQMLDLECALMASEGLFSGFLCLSLIVLLPLSLRLDPRLFLIPFALDTILFVIPTMIYTQIKHPQSILFSYVIHFYFLRLVSSVIFLKSFFQVVFDRDRLMHWISPTRYQVANPPEYGSTVIPY